MVPNHTQLQILEPCQEQPHLVSGHFIKVFFSKDDQPAQDSHFWVVPTVVVLYKFDYINIYHIVHTFICWSMTHNDKYEIK